MTLGNMSQNGVRGLLVTRQAAAATPWSTSTRSGF
jgi:hypothetical protein